MTLTLILSALIALAGPVGTARSEEPAPPTALLIIDVQEFYFADGKVPLVGPDAAAANAGRILEQFRKEGRTVVHVRHEFEPGGSIHPSVAPVENEKVFSKSEVNCFNGTEVLAYLKETGIKRLVICGMMTHMCVEAATRAASDLGFECIVIGNACATRDLKYGDRTVAAHDVHASTLATLSRTYATVVDTDTYLAQD
jgi:nicotinamidase-related amidase